jgi:hypothetical protein
LGDKKVPVTQQRKLMLEELQRRNYSQLTAEAYLRAMKGFVKHFHRAPEQLTQEHIREYQAYLFREHKLSSNTVSQHVSALRFFDVKPLKRPLTVGRTPSQRKIMVRLHFPQARIVADRFHVMRIINHHFLACWRDIDGVGSKNRGLLSLLRRHRHNLRADHWREESVPGN